MKDRARNFEISSTAIIAGTATTAVRDIAFAAALMATLAGMTGCRSDMAAVQQAPIVNGNAANDPANANMANANTYVAVQPANTARYTARTRVAGSNFSVQPESSGEIYSPSNDQHAQSEAYNYNVQQPRNYAQGYQDAQGASTYNDNGNDDQIYAELLDNDVPVVQQPPPPLPVYEQPIAPGPDYLWTPGYWSYSNAGYYYVPGNWVSAPFAGALWTPGWWGYTGRGYGFHRGYWGRHVGYYGGVNYGFGFIGVGYQGGYWNNDHFFYNRNCNHVDARVVNNYVYQRNVTVINNTYVNNARTSYYGGPGGLQRRPLPAEFAAQHETHIGPLPAQTAERQGAAQNRQQFYTANRGQPQQLFAAHPIIERNVNVPAQLVRPGNPNRGGPINGQANGFGGGRPSGLNNANAEVNSFNNSHLQRQQPILIQGQQPSNLQQHTIQQQRSQQQAQHPPQDLVRNGQQQYKVAAEQQRSQAEQQNAQLRQRQIEQQTRQQQIVREQLQTGFTQQQRNIQQQQARRQSQVQQNRQLVQPERPSVNQQRVIQQPAAQRPEQQLNQQQFQVHQQQDRQRVTEQQQQRDQQQQDQQRIQQQRQQADQQRAAQQQQFRQQQDQNRAQTLQQQVQQRAQQQAAQQQEQLRAQQQSRPQIQAPPRPQVQAPPRAEPPQAPVRGDDGRDHRH